MSRSCVRKGKASARASSGAPAFPRRPRRLETFCVESTAQIRVGGERLPGVDVRRGDRWRDRRACPARRAALSRAREGTHRDHRLRRDHRRRPAPRTPDPGDRCGRLRQDAVRDRVPGPRRARLRRARCAAGLRGGPERPGHQRGLARLRPRPAREGRPARDRRLPARPRRDRRDRRLRPRGPVHPAGHGRRVRGRQAGVPRHHRAALQRAAQRGDHPRRARPAVPLAQGARPDGRDQRRARQGGQT